MQPGVYKHYKGNIYLILCVGMHSETQEELVTYVRLGESKVYHRPPKMFNETVVVDDKSVSRFTYLKPLNEKTHFAQILSLVFGQDEKRDVRFVNDSNMMTFQGTISHNSQKNRVLESKDKKNEKA